MTDTLAHIESAVREGLLARVEQIRDVLVRTAAESEEARFLVPEAVEALSQAGLLKMKAARELGGLDATPATQMLVIAAITEIDASAGWNTMVSNNSSGFMSAFLGDEAVAEVFANGVPIAAGVSPPMGKARKADGGYVFTGRWKTCSGVKQASWLRLTGAVEDEPGRTVFGVLPQQDVEIHDTWHVLGLRGTGSFDVSLAGYFVPDHRVVPEEIRLRGGPQYRLRGVAAAAYEHTGIALGMGRRALKELAAFAARKGQPREQLLTDLGRLTMALGAAEALAISAQEAIYEVLSDDTAEVSQVGARGLAVATHVTEVALDCVEAAYRHAGTAGLYMPNPFERLLRDIHGASQHIAVSGGHFRNLGQRLFAASGGAA